MKKGLTLLGQPDFFDSTCWVFHQPIGSSLRVPGQIKISTACCENFRSLYVRKSCLSSHNLARSRSSSAAWRLRVKLPTQEAEDEPDLRRALRSSTRRKTLTCNAPPPGCRAPFLWMRGAPNSAGWERVMRRNNTRWQVVGAPQIDVRVKPAGPDIAQRRVYCAVRPSCRFMRLRPSPRTLI